MVRLHVMSKLQFSCFLVRLAGVTRDIKRPTSEKRRELIHCTNATNFFFLAHCWEWMIKIFFNRNIFNRDTWRVDFPWSLLLSPQSVVTLLILPKQTGVLRFPGVCRHQQRTVKTEQNSQQTAFFHVAHQKRFTENLLPAVDARLRTEHASSYTEYFIHLTGRAERQNAWWKTFAIQHSPLARLVGTKLSE